MNRIALTESEQRDSALSERHLGDACRAIAADGYVVLAGAVPLESLAALRTRMDADTEALLEFQSRHGGNPRAQGHLQQGPPPTPEFVSEAVTANPFAIAVSKSILGDKAYLAFYNGNTNLPGSIYQSVHIDNPHLWPNSAMASPPYSLVINVSPMDCTADNGALEIWPGTHMLANPYEGNQVPAEPVEERRQVRPPIQAITAVGDLLVRDSRLWHRGVPNPSDRPRHMIASIHVAGWYQRGKPIRFARGCEDILEPIDFDFNAEFVDRDIDYLLGPTKSVYRRQGNWRDDKGSAAREPANSGR